MSFETGLSPRTRGSRRQLPDFRIRARSIPAHAGEPDRPIRGTSCARVYPRARGGAWRAIPLGMMRAGLSPRTRGSRQQPHRPRHADGSIPAHAGEPLASQRFMGNRRVYPRARGGAQRRAPFRPVRRGSIPAHAGEPHIGD